MKKRKANPADKSGPSRKSLEAAVKTRVNYELNDNILYRKIFTGDIFEPKAVIPLGGMRSFEFNGRTYRLPLRKAIMLQYHDSESMGAHAGMEDTYNKIKQIVWWAGLERDVKSWVRTCSVCKLTKPQKGLTAAQRSELFDRPFKVIFIDTIGPISPADQGRRLSLIHI